MSEDRQPNEARLGRKGIAAPPTVRSSAPVTNSRDRESRAHGSSTKTRQGWDEDRLNHRSSEYRQGEQNSYPTRSRDYRPPHRDTPPHLPSHSSSSYVRRSPPRLRLHSQSRPSGSDRRNVSPVSRNNHTGDRPPSGPAKPARSRTPPRGPRYPHKLPDPSTGSRRSRHSSPTRSPPVSSSSLWTPTGVNGMKRQRLASMERTPPRIQEKSRSAGLPAVTVPHAPSATSRPANTPSTPPGQFSVKFIIPPEALGASKASLDYRKNWFLDRRREVERDGSRFTTCRWFDDHLLVFAKHPTSQLSTNGQERMPSPRDKATSHLRKPYVYSFTSGTMTIEKPTVPQERTKAYAIHAPVAPSHRQVAPPERKAPPNRAGEAPPTIPASRPVSSSVLVIPPAPAPAPFTRPLSSTTTPTSRANTSSRPNSTSRTATTSFTLYTNRSSSVPATRSAVVTPSSPSGSPPPAIAVLSSPVNVRSSSPRYSPRSVSSGSLSPLPQAKPDLPSSVVHKDRPTPPVNPLNRTPFAPPPPPAGEVILISSDDDHRSSSSSSSDEEEDELASPRNTSLPLRRNSFSPRFTPSPPPSPEPAPGSLPTDEFEMSVEGTVSLPNDNKRDKPRRLLVDRPSGSVFTVMYHGFVDRYGRVSRRRTNVYVPPVPAKEHAEDACAIELRDGMHILVAHSHLSGGRELTLVSRSGHVHHFGRRLRPGDRAGANAVCALPNPRRFVAAGADHSIYHWTITPSAPPSSARLDSDSEDESKAGFSAHERVLPYKHTSAIHALLPLSNTLLASGGADCAVRIFDMGAQALAHTLNPSNAVHNLHSLAATHPNSILLEVSHKELQFEVRDTRIDKTSRVSRFGWVASKTSGKYVRGAVRGEVFACGDRDGIVRVWDLRNTRRPIETKNVFRGAKVVQVVFDGGRMYAASEGNELAFINTV